MAFEHGKKKNKKKKTDEKWSFNFVLFRESKMKTIIKKRREKINYESESEIRCMWI